jgi:hypothetical protein
LQAAKSVWNSPPGLRADMRCIRRRATFSTEVPGPALDGPGSQAECDQLATISIAVGSSSRAVASRASATRIGYVVPTSPSPVTRAGARAAASSATSEPMLWPASTARATPAASSRASSQSAIASTEAKAAPVLRPCPGRSGANTAQPACARLRLCSAHTEWSFWAPWSSTTTGSAGSNGLPPV